jgi:hypothetical protein
MILAFSSFTPSMAVILPLMVPGTSCLASMEPNVAEFTVVCEEAAVNASIQDNNTSIFMAIVLL